MYSEGQWPRRLAGRNRPEGTLGTAEYQEKGTREIACAPRVRNSQLQCTLSTTVSWLGVVVPGFPRKSVQTVCAPPAVSTATPV